MLVVEGTGAKRRSVISKTMIRRLYDAIMASHIQHHLSTVAVRNQITPECPPCSPEHMGLLDPATSDGRVIFFLPWLKGTIAGTTDLPCQITHSPRPTEDEIQFILTEVKNYLNPDVEGIVCSGLSVPDLFSSNKYSGASF